jgi:hypothetical protein
MIPDGGAIGDVRESGEHLGKFLRCPGELGTGHRGHISRAESASDSIASALFVLRTMCSGSALVGSLQKRCRSSRAGWCTSRSAPTRR